MAVKTGNCEIWVSHPGKLTVPTWKPSVDQGPLAASLPALSCGRKSGSGSSLQYSWQFLPRRDRGKSQS